MKIYKYTHLWLLPLFFAMAAESFGQNLPVGTGVLEDYFRRAQLLGKVDSTISFTVRPLPVTIYQEPAKGSSTGYLPNDAGLFMPQSEGEKPKHRMVFQLLPVNLFLQNNNDHPVGYNDGAMIPARGFQQMVSAGFFAKLGPLSLQIRPEYVFAANRDFQQFYKERKDQIWYEYSELYNFIDQPERFGEKAYSKLLWGQSSIRLTFDPISIGLSSENLWWGPGLRSSLLMTNSAAGFKHITVNTVKPVKTALGSFEGQLISARLENSGILPPDTNRTYIGYKLYIRKRDEWRYLNGIVLSWQPKWVPGLFLGFTKSIMMYGEDMGPRLRDILPVVFPRDKKNKYGEFEPLVAKDQRSSLFFRWLMKESNAEIYAEYGREDHAYDARDLVVQMEYSRAYMLGFNKMIPYRSKRDQYIQVNLELTEFEQNNSNPEKLWRYWYSSRDIRQGYTHQGQLLGSGIGPGSNLQSLRVAWVKELKTIGVQFERYVHNNDLHNVAIKDSRGNWVDLNLALLGDWNYKNFLFNARIQLTQSFNYQDYYRPAYVNPELFWIPGKDVFNFQGQLGISYRF